MEEFILFFFKLQKENHVKHNIMHFHSGEATLAGRLKQIKNKKSRKQADFKDQRN